VVTAALARAVDTRAIAEVIVRDGLALIADHAVVTPDGDALRTWAGSRTA